MMKTDMNEVDFKHFFTSLHSPQLIVKADKELTIMAHNEAHARIGMVEQGSIVGMPFLTAFPDTTKKFKETGVSDLAESLYTVIRTGKPDTLPLLHYDIKNSRGELVEKWWRATHYPIFDAAGNVTSVYQATEDVTSEIVAQAELQRTEAMLKSAQELGVVSTYSWDMQSDSVIGDATFARRFGITTKQAQSGLPLQIFVDSIHPDDRDRVNEMIDAAVTEHVPYKIDYRTIQHDKKVIWNTAVGKIVPDESGAPRYFNGLLIDITERKEAESLLAESEERFKALFDSNIAGICTVKMNGNILQANPTFLKMFGYKKTDLKKGITSEQLSFITNDPVSQMIYGSLRNTGQSEPLRKEYQRKDGKVFTGLVGAAMLPERDDEFVAFVIDVTETEKLKELNKVKDEFIAMASHQLRTPASTVKQYLGVLIDEYAGTLNEDQLQFANIANDANERAITIIEDLLRTAQIDVKGYELAISTFDLVQTIDQIITECQPFLELRKQTLKFKHDTPVVTVKADHAEIKTSITNLVENASKYSQHGTSITVAIKQTKQHVQISVTDQGVGIAEADFPKIFDKFTRVNNPLSDTVTGSGLGLYWVRRIAELHKGKLTVASQIGKGTTFTILLPI